MTLRNIGAIAAALLAVALFKYWITPDREPGFAFGAVQKVVEKTKSVQYVQKCKEVIDGRAEPETMANVMILGPHQMREEVEITKPGDPPPQGKFRSEPENYTTVRNVKTGRLIRIVPDKKGYVMPLTTLRFDRDSGEFKEEKIKPAPDVDFYQRVREFSSESATKLPDCKIDGKMAAGFQTVETIKRPSGDDTWTRTYWIDPETKLPVRIEVVNEYVQLKSTVRSEIVQTDFVFDAPLDEALFRIHPPEGYKNFAPLP